MNQIDNNVNPLVKMSSDFGRIFRFCVLYTFLALSPAAFLGLLILDFQGDDFLYIFIPIAICLILGLIVAYIINLKNLKPEINVYQDRISGKLLRKEFFLPIEFIQSVQGSGINGIAITNKQGKKYNFNIDKICTVLNDLGVVVDRRLIKIKDTIITGESDSKKHSLMRIFSLLSMILSNIFAVISTFWYISSSNWYYSHHSFGYGSLGYGYYCYYEIDEMPTTYIAIGLFVVFLVLTALYFVKANNKVTLNSTMFRGVNGFGKVTLIPIEQISSATISSIDSSITINQMGKKRKFYWLINNALLCEAINNIKLGKYQSAVAEQSFSNAGSTDNNEIKAKNITESAEEIQKFKSLLDDGVITEEEFNSMKKQILNL